LESFSQSQISNWNKNLENKKNPPKPKIILETKKETKPKNPLEEAILWQSPPSHLIGIELNYTDDANRDKKIIELIESSLTEKYLQLKKSKLKILSQSLLDRILSQSALDKNSTKFDLIFKEINHYLRILKTGFFSDEILEKSFRKSFHEAELKLELLTDKNTLEKIKKLYRGELI
jgi:hypothetical protein